MVYSKKIFVVCDDFSGTLEEYDHAETAVTGQGHVAADVIRRESHGRAELKQTETTRRDNGYLSDSE